MKKPEALILAIESSCDDTSVAVLKGFEVLSNVIFSQDIHSYYGGVVPEMASRAHIESIVPTIKASLKASNIKLDQIEAIAVTQGPGLLGSLLVGHSIALQRLEAGVDRQPRKVSAGDGADGLLLASAALAEEDDGIIRVDHEYRVAQRLARSRALPVGAHDHAALAEPLK